MGAPSKILLSNCLTMNTYLKCITINGTFMQEHEEKAALNLLVCFPCIMIDLKTGPKQSMKNEVFFALYLYEHQCLY